MLRDLGPISEPGPALWFRIGTTGFLYASRPNHTLLDGEGLNKAPNTKRNSLMVSSFSLNLHILYKYFCAWFGCLQTMSTCETDPKKLSSVNRGKTFLLSDQKLLFKGQKYTEAQLLCLKVSLGWVSDRWRGETRTADNRRPMTVSQTQIL